MFAELGHKTLMLDADPQANLTSMLLTDGYILDLIEQSKTILSPLTPLSKGIGDLDEAFTQTINQNLFLISGDLGLSALEDDLSNAWFHCLNKKEPAFRLTSAFYRMAIRTGTKLDIDYVFIDVGPNLGALNRAVMLSADHVIVPVAADLFSLQGIKNLGVALRNWRREWQEDRLPKNTDPNLELPSGSMAPLGYVVLQHEARHNRPVKAYERWANRIPYTFAQHVMGIETSEDTDVTNDKYCLGMLKHYRSLAPMSMEVHKPMFLLKPGDGAIGAHFEAVQRCYRDFKTLAEKIKHSVDASVA
jgi:cellulose biosynthesis protein BcsQ